MSYHAKNMYKLRYKQQEIDYETHIRKEIARNWLKLIGKSLTIIIFGIYFAWMFANTI